MDNLEGLCMSTYNSRVLRRIRNWCMLLFRAVFIVVNHLYTIPTYMVWYFGLMPLRLVVPETYWYIEGKLFKWLLSMIATWMWAAGYSVVETGEDIGPCMNEPTLVLINHQSTADVPVLFYCLQDKPYVLSKVMWIMDRIFMYTTFGWVSLCHGDFFIQQGKAYKDQQLLLLQKHIHKTYWSRGRNWIMLFPEGGLLRKRRNRSQIFASKNGLPLLHYVALPRVGAMETILHAVGVNSTKNHVQALNNNKKGGLKWVVDITIAYQDCSKPLDLKSIVGGFQQSQKTTICYRKFPVYDIPYESTEMLTKWVYDRFTEKECMLKYFYETGTLFKFEKYADGRVVQKESYGDREIPNAPGWWLVSLHFFFVSSTWFHYWLFGVLRTWI